MGIEVDVGEGARSSSVGQSYVHDYTKSFSIFGFKKSADFFFFNQESNGQY